MTAGSPFASRPLIHAPTARSHGHRSSSVSGVPEAIVSTFAADW